MSGASLAAEVAASLQGLHREFEAWLRGTSTDLSRVEASLAPSFCFIPPNGETVSRETLFERLKGAHGTRQLRIRVEAPAIRLVEGSLVVATYEEWHDHEGYTTARQASAVLSRSADAPDGFLWCLVHETWIRPPPGRSPPPAG